MIYLDHAATTPTDGRVIEEMARCMREHWRNPPAAYAGLAIFFILTSAAGLAMTFFYPETGGKTLKQD